MAIDEAQRSKVEPSLAGQRLKHVAQSKYFTYQVMLLHSMDVGRVSRPVLGHDQLLNNCLSPDRDGSPLPSA